MNTTQLHEEGIFLDALEVTDLELRHALIVKRCGSDLSLRARVIELVRLSAVGGILDDSAVRAAGMDEEQVEMPEVGAVIGNYELVEEIGVGGMGVVFKAHQKEPVSREVAIKVIKLGMDTKSVITRFEAERQAMAMMDHPFVTQVYDAGATEAGRPYFVMELVRGTAINQFCDDKRLTIDERLQLFVKACQAIQHAHEKGIIHRDVKPSNILVTEHDSNFIPKIIDFGIAKATNRQLTEQTMITHFGQMVGTPMYMSPEQAEMGDEEVDARSDIYSLGVVLYELLTSEPPFAELKNSGFPKIRDAIQTVEPDLASTRIGSLTETREVVSLNRGTDPRTLGRAVKGELDWILCRCLAKSRSERYASAGDLAREVQRYLKGETVEAAAPTISYRVNKYINRHRSVMIAGSLIAIVLIVSSIVAIRFGISANRMANRAEDAKKMTAAAEISVAKERDRAAQAEQELADLKNERRQEIAVFRELRSEDGGFLLAAGESGAGGIVQSPFELMWDVGVDGDVDHSYNDSNGTVEIDTSNYGNADGGMDALKHVESQVAGSKQGDCPHTLPGSLQTGSSKKPACSSSQIEATRRVWIREWVEWEKFTAKKRVVNNSPRKAARILQIIGEMHASNKNWENAEFFFRKAQDKLGSSLEFDSPELFRIRLLVTESMLAQKKYYSASEEIESISLDAECLIDSLPEDVEALLGRLRMEASKILGRDI